MTGCAPEHVVPAEVVFYLATGGARFGVLLLAVDHASAGVRHLVLEESPVQRPKMDRGVTASCWSSLDADALMTVVDDVWTLQSPPTSPFAGFELLSEDYDTTKEKKLKKKRRRDRNRPCHEIKRLQGEAEELNGDLQKQLARSSKKARSSFSTHVKNAELKALLRENIEDMRALEQNLSKQMNELVRMLPRSINMTPRNLPYDTVQDDSVFRKMARNVDEQYKDMERVLRLAGLNGTNSEVADAFICRSKSVTGALLKSRTRILSPFKSSALVSALWKNVENDEGATMRTEQATKELDLSQQDLASRIAVQKYEVAVDDHVCTMRMVMKQFIEKDRVVQVWSVLADWPRVGGMRDVQTHEQGWGFIQPLNESTSVCLNYCLMNPTIGCVHSSESCETQFEFLAKLYQNMIISRLHMLENQTLDQVIQEKRNGVAVH